MRDIFLFLLCKSRCEQCCLVASGNSVLFFTLAADIKLGEHSACLDVLHEVNLRKIEHLGILDLKSGLLHDLTGTLDVVALEGYEASVDHTHIGDCSGVLLGKRSLKRLQVEVLCLFIVVHTAFESCIGNRALNVSDSDILDERLVYLP